MSKDTKDVTDVLTYLSRSVTFYNVTDLLSVRCQRRRLIPKLHKYIQIFTPDPLRGRQRQPRGICQSQEYFNIISFCRHF